MAQARVGISGWSYPRWRGDFYPVGLPQKQELQYAAERLTTIEVNASFYSLQRPSTYRGWREQVPDGFTFALKGGRFITHLKRLRDVETPLANFFASGVLGLGDVFGPMLWQLPERVAYDEDTVGHFLSMLPRNTGAAARLAREHDAKVPETLVTVDDDDRPLRHALEFRHRSFCEPAALDLLRKHDVAAVVADSAGRWPQTFETTADHVYVRLHGDAELYASGYADESLDVWAERCRGWVAQGLDVHVYFDNDAKGHAPHDAVRLLRRLATD
jgi:uncharacterized protein YecE (DUF72 family)